MTNDEDARNERARKWLRNQWGQHWPDKMRVEQLAAYDAFLAAAAAVNVRCTHCGVSFEALKGPVPLPPTRERVEIDAKDIGITLRASEEEKPSPFGKVQP